MVLLSEFLGVENPVNRAVYVGAIVRRHEVLDKVPVMLTFLVTGLPNDLDVAAVGVIEEHFPEKRDALTSGNNNGVPSLRQKLFSTDKVGKVGPVFLRHALEALVVVWSNRKPNTRTAVIGRPLSEGWAREVDVMSQTFVEQEEQGSSKSTMMMVGKEFQEDLIIRVINSTHSGPTFLTSNRSRFWRDALCQNSLDPLSAKQRLA